MIWIFYNSFFRLKFEYGVREEICSKKNSRIYFLIKLSFIVFAILLNFFSNIAIEDGSSLSLLSYND